MYLGTYANDDYVSVVIPYLASRLGKDSAIVQRCINAGRSGTNILQTMNDAYTIYDRLRRSKS